MPAPTHTYDPWQLIVEVRELPGAGAARPRSPHLPRSAQRERPAAPRTGDRDPRLAGPQLRAAGGCMRGRARAAREDRWA